ncbi:MAG: hypothetical protein RLZZ381_3331, partial [Cyanobacteriota bacterium]
MKAEILTTFIIFSVLNTLVYGCTTNNPTESKKQTVKQNTSNQNVQFVCDRSYDRTSSKREVEEDLDRA